MLVYRFKPERRSDLRVALTSDKTGEILPGDGAPWKAIGEIDLRAAQPWIKVPPADIEAAIANKGFYVWKITLVESERKSA